MSVFEAVERDLKLMGEKASDSTLGATALALAHELDSSRNSATSKSMCAKSMVEVLRELRALAPPKQEADGVTDLTARREARRRTAAAGSASS